MKKNKFENKWLKKEKYILFYFSFNFIIIFNLFILSKPYIVLPFKIQFPKNYENITQTFNDLLDNKLIVTFQMGNPKKNIDFYASMNDYIYYLEEGSCNSEYTSSSYYYTESKTFAENKNNKFCGVKLDEYHLGSDSFYLYQDIGLKTDIENKMDFYYGIKNENKNKNDKRICGTIGFKIANDPFRFYDYENFITTLKQNKIINSYSWYVHYFDNKINNFDGAIILDIFNPKFFEDFPYLKKDDDYNTINAKDLQSILAWTFEFDKIYYNYNDTNVDIKLISAGLAFETDFIHCPEAYFASIQKFFFNPLLADKICFLIEDRYNYIYCDKQRFEKYKQIFPSLFFKNSGLNKTYILNSEDLFKDCGKYYFFMIIQPKYGYKIWTLGKIFMKKSKFYFDSNKKLIGYFEGVDKKINVEKNDSKTNFFDKIKWYIFIAIGIAVGIFIGNRIREKARKLRANELEDNYEYLENKAKDNNSDTNKDNNDNNINTNNNSNYNEIKTTQLYNINE